MAYKDPGKEMQRRADALVKGVNSALADYYKTAKTKPGDQISISVAHGKGGIQRTPEEQAEFVLEGKSWTLNSSHMSDGAKHILVKHGHHAPTWNLNLLAAKQKEAFAVMNKAWNDAMKAQDVRNFAGGRGFAVHSDDPLHMELPD